MNNKQFRIGIIAVLLIGMAFYFKCDWLIFFLIIAFFF